MVLKAIDMQVLIPRSHEVGKIQQLQLQQPINENYHTGAELSRDFSIQENSVTKLEQMKNGNIRDDQKGMKKQGSRRENKPQDENDFEEEINVVSHLGNILDIHI